MQQAWQQAVENLEKVLSERDFATWIKPIAYSNHEGETVYISVPTLFFKEWLEEHYHQILVSALSITAGKNFSIEIIVRENTSGTELLQPEDLILESHQAIEETKNNQPDSTVTPLNRKYTFDLFVSGTGNQFAHAAAMAVANNPADT